MDGSTDSGLPSSHRNDAYHPPLEIQTWSKKETHQQLDKFFKLIIPHVHTIYLIRRKVNCFVSMINVKIIKN
jgi:hypothetical protein